MTDRFTPTEKNYYIMWLFTLSLGVICYVLIRWHDLPCDVPVIRESVPPL